MEQTATEAGWKIGCYGKFDERMEWVEEIDCKTESNTSILIDMMRNIWNAWQIDLRLYRFMYPFQSECVCVCLPIISILCAHFSYFDYIYHVLLLGALENAATS